MVLWLITIWRAPGAWRNRQKRPLWVAFAVLASNLLLSNNGAARAFDLFVGVNSLSALLKHLAAVTAAACVVAFLDGALASAACPPTRARAHTVVPIATAALMITLFGAAGRPHEAVDMLLAYPRDLRITAYTLIWTLYFGWALATATRLSWRWSRRPGPVLLQRGLAIICLGTSIGILYAIHRAGMLFTERFNVHPVSKNADSAINALLAVIPLLLIAAGSTLPAVEKIREAARHHRDVHRLYPLWDALTSATPHIRLKQRPTPLRDLLNVRTPRERLYRRTIEIRDAILVLNDCAPVAVRLRAADHVEDAGLPDTAAATAAEACWVRAAREARVAGHLTSGTVEPPAKAGTDLDTEVLVLASLSDAYFSPLSEEFARQHLARLNRSEVRL
ncbi:MAB_1171c family putative transporter [Peterkaempfera griseoplana]|uniref:MAB_1171c family putative transporter n=1 Tax=Peterkaempfera griseoplana TaxID=66896 RepID=UPI002AFEA706|nr:MAB_1171c family putative transporter [Peterkaempfera griseoplana]